MNLKRRMSDNSPYLPYFNDDIIQKKIKLERGGGIGPAAGETELASKCLIFNSKRYFIDVKENSRGRFIKVVEVSPDGRRNQIFLTVATAIEIRCHFAEFNDFNNSLGNSKSDNPSSDSLLTKAVIKETRRYYLDLKENNRGRFLKISQINSNGGPRTQILIPAENIIEFRDALSELLMKYGNVNGEFKDRLPEGQRVRVDNKSFYFDISQNNRGVYMRISEVKTDFRTEIIVPQKSWEKFRDILADCCIKIKEESVSDKTSDDSKL